MSKKELQQLFLKPKSAMKAKGVPNESLGKKDAQSRKSLEKKLRSFPQSLGKHINSTGSKSNKEVTLKTRETCFLYKKTQKPKNVKALFFQKLFYFVKSHSAVKILMGSLVSPYFCKQFFWFFASLEPTYPCFLDILINSGKPLRQVAVRRY